MARDIYGELLARTLNRGAPPGHSAAYITRPEALQLRASGGGVAPGGGQYMANGIPSFQESGGVDPGISDPTGPTGGLGSAGHEMGMSSSWNSPAERGMAAAEQAQRDAGTEGLAHSLGDMFTAFAPAPASVPAAPETLHEIAAKNIERAINNPNLYNKNTSTWTEAGVAELGEDISSSPFAAGYHSPAATLARNNKDATAGQVAAVNQHSDRTGGYSVNDPHGNVSVPAGMNMGMIPALAGTIAGFASPFGLPMMMAGYPTLTSLGLNAARADTGMIGSAMRGFQTNITDPINRAFDAVTQPITQPIGQLGNFLGSGVRAGVSAVGDFLNENVVDPLGGFATGLGEDITGALPDLPGLPGFSIGDVLSQGETPVGTFQGPQTGGNQEVYVPPQPAPITEPFVSDSTERQFADIPPDIPPEILARILANEKFGRERVGLA